jgi:hypothetical protein
VTWHLVALLAGATIVLALLIIGYWIAVVLTELRAERVFDRQKQR